MSRSGKSGGHVSEYIAIVRERARLFLALFFLIVVAIMTYTLLQAPTYRASATLLVNTMSAERGGVLGELQALGSGPSVQSELELMRSRAVARRAFDRLRPADFVVEQDADRPLETLIRSVRGDSVPGRLQVETSPLVHGRRPATYRFTIRGTTHPSRASGSIEIVKRRPTRFFWEQDIVGSETVSFEPGKPFRVFDRTFTAHASGAVEDRSFKLTLRNAEDGALWIQRRVQAHEIGRGTGVVRLQFGAGTPHLAQRVVGALAAAYLDLKAEHKKTHAKIALEFIEKESARVVDSLRSAEQELDEFRARSSAVLLSQRARWLVEQSSRLELERAEAKLQQSELVSLRRHLASESGAAAALSKLGGGRADPLTNALTQQLTALELERQRVVRDGVRDAHPVRRKLEADIMSTKERLRSALDAGLSQAERRVEKRVQHLDATLKEHGRATNELPFTERELAKRTRAVEADLRIYEFLVQKGQEAQIAQASALAGARLIDAPLLPRERASPHVMKRLLLALGLAVVIGVLGTFVVAYFDRTIRSPAELEAATDLSLFATIPEFRSVLGRRSRDVGALVIEHGNDALCEPYRALRANLHFANIDRPIQTMAITSAVPGEGKSVTNCNLAAVYAQMGDSVIVVDADLRKPTTHTIFGNPRGPGLTDVLSGSVDWRSVVRRTGVENLSVLHAGRAAKRPATLLAGSEFQQLLIDLRAQYTRVIFDVPPVLAVADAAGFLASLDGVLLLTSYGKCTADVVGEARDQLRRLGVAPLGAVLNNVDMRRSKSMPYGSYAEYSDPPPRRRSRRTKSRA